MTTVEQLMTADPVIISPETTLQEAARKMQNIDCGFLPIGTIDRLEGVITDRDIAIRAVAMGADVKMETVRNYMTTNLFFCQKEDTVEEAAVAMRENEVNRLLVTDRNGRPCGVLTFGRILREDSDRVEIVDVIENATGNFYAA